MGPPAEPRRGDGWGLTATVSFHPSDVGGTVGPAVRGGGAGVLTQTGAPAVLSELERIPKHRILFSVQASIEGDRRCIAHFGTQPDLVAVCRVCHSQQMLHQGPSHALPAARHGDVHLIDLEPERVAVGLSPECGARHPLKHVVRMRDHKHVGRVLQVASEARFGIRRIDLVAVVPFCGFDGPCPEG